MGITMHQNDSTSCTKTAPLMIKSMKIAPSGRSVTSSNSGRWQRGDADSTERARLRSKIADVISHHKPSKVSEREWVSVKLPKMTRHIERILYRNAASLEEYREEETLRLRLRLYGGKVSRQRRGGTFNLKEMKATLPSVSTVNGICA